MKLSKQVFLFEPILMIDMKRNLLMMHRGPLTSNLNNVFGGIQNTYDAQK